MTRQAPHDPQTLDRFVRDGTPTTRRRTNKVEDLRGRHFGRLRVICRAGRAHGGHITWLCACDCGVIKPIRGEYLRAGRTKSCGCLRHASPIVSAELTQQIIALYQSGLSLRDIEKRTPCSRMAITRALQRAGIPRRPAVRRSRQQEERRG